MFVYELSGCRLESGYSHLKKLFWIDWNLRQYILDFALVSSKEFLDIQTTIDCGFTLKRVCDMIRTCSLFSLLFCLVYIKIVDSMDIYKSLNINIGTVTKNPKMLKFVPGHLKTKKMFKHALKNLPCLLR